MGVERRHAAVLAADVVGYSRLMETGELGTLRILHARTSSSSLSRRSPPTRPHCQDDGRRSACRICQRCGYGDLCGGHAEQDAGA